METDKLEQTAVNDSGTALDSDTRLTQRRSRRVRGKGNKKKASPEVRKLIMLRAKFGADTRPGHVCSDVVEEIENWQAAKAQGNEFWMGRLRMLMPRRIGIISEARTAA